LYNASSCPFHENDAYIWEYSKTAFALPIAYWFGVMRSADGRGV